MMKNFKKTGKTKRLARAMVETKMGRIVVQTLKVLDNRYFVEVDNDGLVEVEEYGQGWKVK